MNKYEMYQIPSVVFDYWMTKLSDSQFKVLMAIATRPRICWEIQEMTGFVEKTVKAALDDLMHFGLITETKYKTYHLNELEDKESHSLNNPRPETKERKKFNLKRDQNPFFEEMKALNVWRDDKEIITKIRDAFKNDKVQWLRKEISDIRNQKLKN